MLAGLLPVAFTAWLSYLEVSRGWQQNVERTLRQNAKERGQELMGRLQAASRAVVESTRLISTGRQEQFHSSPYLLEFFDAAWLVAPSGEIRQILGERQSSINRFLSDETIFTTPTRLHVDRQTSPATILLESRSSIGSGIKTLVFSLKPSHVWTPVDHIQFPNNSCVVDASGNLLHCARPLDEKTLKAHINPLAPEFQSRDSADDGFASQRWQLFLAGEFYAPSFQVIAIQPKHYALRSNADFMRVFVPSLLLVMLLIGLLSFRLIGKSLSPLRRLTAATNRLADGNFDTRVRIGTGDEFEKLADAFNQMATNLQKQITMQESVSSIDKMILSGVGFDEVAEAVLEHVMRSIVCHSAGIVALDNDSPQWSRLITRHDGKIENQRILTPALSYQTDDRSIGFHLVAVAEHDQTYTEQFRSFASEFLGIIPIVLESSDHGLLVLGFSQKPDLKDDGIQRCLDLADRFAVALSSVNREAALYRQAHFDDLTGLPNRQLLQDRLEQQIRRTKAAGSTAALLFMDLDRFKEINDVYGHSVGDVVLAQAADRIVSAIGETGTVARLGGDEFVIILPDAHDEKSIRKVASNLLARMADSFSVRDTDHFLGASIGIVVFPDDGDSAETLLKNADSAMYSAKSAGRCRFEFFSQSLNAQSRRKIELERDLRSAFENEELELHYQPQFDTTTSVMCGAEALLRWRRGDAGFVSPAEFIPLAEDSNLIVDIGRWVIRRACKDLRIILDKGLHPGTMSINVSARQLKEPAFVGDIFGPLAEFEIDPRNLHVEVTETAVAENRDIAIALLTEIRNNGVQIALDDFGTGYSSMGYLQQLPFDVIKIDQTFVSCIGESDTSDSICRTIIKMADELGKRSIAEGVENADQMQFLARNGCDIVQGYHLSMPLTFDDLLKFMEKQDFHTQRREALELV